MTTIKTAESKQVVKDLEKYLSTVSSISSFPSRLQIAPLNETWFSDHLAWLLDVRATHGFGTAFAKQFLKIIAEKRSDISNNYIQRTRYLRLGRAQSKGSLWSQFNLGNSSVYREFYLANSKQSSIAGGSALCDVAFLDLDSKDGIFVGIENKLFTTNRKGQLESYFALIESRYHRAKVVEYVFLTLLGEAPFHHKDGDAKICDRAWIKLSWIHDILKILVELPETDNRDVKQLKMVLTWMKSMLSHTDLAQIQYILHNLISETTAAATDCIVDELKRLNIGARGEWKIQRRGKRTTRIIHTSKPKTPLYVSVSSNLSISLYNKAGKNSGFDKLWIPFGSNPDQLFNLIDLTSRDIYSLHFGENYRNYLGGKKKLTTSIVPSRLRCRQLFAFSHRHRHEIQLLMAMLRRV